MKKRVATMHYERAAALLMLVVGLSGAVWMHSEAASVTAIAGAREQQLEHLATLLQPVGHRPVDDRALAAFDGLFPDHEVVWLHTSAGPVLSLDTSADGAL